MTEKKLSGWESTANSTMVIPDAEIDTSRYQPNILNISFGPLSEHKADIYLPTCGERPWPLIVYIHGGAWMIGDKRKGFLTSIIDARNYGYAILSVDYRLYPNVVYPEFLYDVKAAVRWAREHAREYGFDAGRFAAIGDSAGGNLALMLGLTADLPAFDGPYGNKEVSSAVQAVCDMYGPAILDGDDAEFFRESGVTRQRLMTFNDGFNIYEPVFGSTDKAFLHAVSPVNLVRKDAPPILIQHGLRDSLVPYQHSRILAQRIREVCGDERVCLREYPERDHGDIGFVGEANAKEVISFFDKYLK